MKALTVAATALLLAAAVHAQDKPTLQTARELKWVDVPELAGARQAPLWGDPRSGDNGTLVRWRINTRLRDLVRTQDLHILVLTGTVTITVQGEYREFGPGGFLSVPKGVPHSLGCEASGECRFLVHHPGAVQVTTNK